MLLRQADGRGLRLHVDAGGVRPLVVDGGDAHDVLRRDLAHGAGGVRQLRAAEDAVADGVDAGDARLHLVVYDDAAAVVFNLPGVEVQALRVRAAADGDEQVVDQLGGIAAAARPYVGHADGKARQQGKKTRARAVSLPTHMALSHPYAAASAPPLTGQVD